MHELGESGDSTAQLVLDTKLLWVKGPGFSECPKTINFQMTLPTTFMTEGNTYVRYLVVFSLASNPTDILTAFTSNIQGQAEGYPRIYCLD